MSHRDTIDLQKALDVLSQRIRDARTAYYATTERDALMYRSGRLDEAQDALDAVLEAIR